jgi:hypothetical protein
MRQGRITNYRKRDNRHIYASYLVSSGLSLGFEFALALIRRATRTGSVSESATGAPTSASLVCGPNR